MHSNYSFKDNFSKQSEIYSKFRPSYPKELFSYLNSLTANHELAWDCGTGNGQSAVQLAKYYDQVYASDPSREQINHAIKDDKITYYIENAEHANCLTDHSVDLITVAQAVHWFDFDTFYTEVKRVLKANGIIAVWAYGTPSVDADIDLVIKNFYEHIIGEFWLPEIKFIDQEYKTLPFPFQEIKSSDFYIKKQLTLQELLGFFRSWSATQRYIDYYGENPIERLSTTLKQHWHNIESKKLVSWKLILKIGKVAD